MKKYTAGWSATDAKRGKKMEKAYTQNKGKETCNLCEEETRVNQASHEGGYVFVSTVNNFQDWLQKWSVFSQRNLNKAKEGAIWFWHNENPF